MRASRASDRLRRANEKLDPYDHMIFLQSNGRFALYHIERGAIPMHGTAYDRYVRIGKSHATVGEALKVARCRLAKGGLPQEG
jgi:hypothetical protein